MKIRCILFALVACAALCACADALDVQGLVDAAAAKGGGRATVPAGTWRTGPIHLRSGVELHLSEGAVLDFSTNPDDYLPKVKTSWQGEEMEGLSPLVYAYGVTNAAITGTGTLKTENGPWKTWFRAKGGRLRPQFIQFFLCKDVRLEDFKVRGSPFWTIHLYRTDDVLVKGLDVSAFDSTGLGMMNSDGIDVECSSRVRIVGCTFDQSDDAIVLKSGRDEDGIRRGIPTADVLVEDCTVKRGHTLLGIGSEVGGGIRDVTLRRCRVRGEVHRLVFLKTNAKRGGYMRNIVAEDIEADAVRDAVVSLTANYWYRPRPGTKNLHRTPIQGVRVSRVRVKEAAVGIELQGDPQLPAEDVSIEELDIGRVTRRVFDAVNVKNLRVGGYRVKEPPQGVDCPKIGGQEGDPKPPASVSAKSGPARIVAKKGGDIVARVRADLSRPVLANAEKMVWDATLADLTRLDRAADAKWTACRDAAAVQRLQGDLRRRMTDAIGGFPDRTPLNAQVTEVVPRDGYRVEKVYFESLPKFYETGLLYRPEGPGPFPAVAIACGHSGNGKGARDYQRACVQLAQAGIAAFIYDPVDQGERIQLADGGNVHGHNRIGIRAALLGWSMARFRVWDAMRALDYLASRSDVDTGSLGFMGNSGGGTLTSLTMALDGRIRAAAPSCYLSTLRAVCEDCGPQDAEQNIFGQLAFGLNHLGYVALRAPRATLMVCKEKDFFPIRGARETRELAGGVYAAAGLAEACAMFVAPGGHGWAESTRTASVAWMRRWLKDEPDAFGEDRYGAFIAKDAGFKIETVDFGLNPGFEVSPGGNVRNLPGAVTAYDLMRAEAARQEKSRPALTAEGVRAVAGIRPVAELVAREPVKHPASKAEGYVAVPWTLDAGDGVTLTAVELRPEGTTTGAPVLLLPSEGRESVAARVTEFLKNGRRVLVADLRGFGETGRKGHRFYGSAYQEEGVAAMTYLCGRNLVSLRAEDAVRLARAWAKASGASAVEAVSVGRAAIPLAHAVATAPEVFAATSFEEPPPSWRAMFEDDGRTAFYADVVNGAWRLYDWVDLIRRP
ncbi:MAG: glycosyl hydrolase family 28 protein [Kiritimatiellia bacterium]